MTKTEAINRILRGCGLHPVTALDTGGNSTQAHAERVLDEKVLEILARGWHFNSRKGIELEPDGDDHITPQDGTITAVGDGSVAQVGERLFDTQENTDVFSDNETVDLTLRYAFHCIPYPIRLAITDAAATEFCRAYGEARRLPMLMRTEQMSMTHARRYDVQSRKTNVLDTDEARQITGNRNRIVD